MDNKVNSENIRALVVDDGMANALVLSSMLERYGIKADTAESGMEAIEKACDAKYDLIFMDYLMPDMDGVEATRQIMFVSKEKEKPLIMGVSATVDIQVTDKFQRAGAEGVLKKPVHSQDLEQLLNEKYGIVRTDSDIEEPDDEIDLDSNDFLAAVQGLNYEEGLALMAGSLENYMKVLEVSVRNIMENYDKIDVIRNTEQMEIMALYFHSLKGIFLNIGADDLANDSKMMEFAAKEFENLYVHQQMDEYMDKIKNFHSQLSDVCDIYKKHSSDNAAGGSMEESEFEKNLVKLKECTENFEYIEITEVLEKMLSSSEGERAQKLQEVYDCIQNFQYDDALAIIGRL